MKKLLLFLVVTLTIMAANAKDIKTVVFTTSPPMHCEGCENRIKSNLRFEKGVKKIVTNVEKQTVTITYDADKTTIENLIRGFEKIDYIASEVKADEQTATSTAECDKGGCAAEKGSQPDIQEP